MLKKCCRFLCWRIGNLADTRGEEELSEVEYFLSSLFQSPAGCTPPDACGTTARGLEYGDVERRVKACGERCWSRKQVAPDLFLARIEVIATRARLPREVSSVGNAR